MTELFFLLSELSLYDQYFMWLFLRKQNNLQLITAMSCHLIWDVNSPCPLLYEFSVQHQTHKASLKESGVCLSF